MFSMLGRRLVSVRVLETEPGQPVLSARESKMTEKSWTPLLRADSEVEAVRGVMRVAVVRISSQLFLVAKSSERVLTLLLLELEEADARSCSVAVARLSQSA